MSDKNNLCQLCDADSSIILKELSNRGCTVPINTTIYRVLPNIRVCDATIQDMADELKKRGYIGTIIESRFKREYKL